MALRVSPAVNMEYNELHSNYNGTVMIFNEDKVRMDFFVHHNILNCE